MQGLQCDSCRTFAPGPPPPDGWLILLRQETSAVPSLFAMIGAAGSGSAEPRGTFCSLRCLVEWGYVKLAADGAQDARPQPGEWFG